MDQEAGGMNVCRYFVSGFQPRRSGVWLTADFMVPGDQPGQWRLRALTGRRLAERAYKLYAAFDCRSVALRDNRTVEGRWHLFGPEWHGARHCPQCAVDTDTHNHAAHNDG